MHFLSSGLTDSSSKTKIRRTEMPQYVDDFSFLIDIYSLYCIQNMFAFKMVPYDFRIALNCPTLEKIV